jgi:penicillin-binding protein 1C
MIFRLTSVLRPLLFTPRRRMIFIAVVVCGGLVFAWFLRPLRLFSDPYSLVVEDRLHGLVGARIATDGQWRFPPGARVPAKFRAAAVAFEDKRFFLHPGIDPVSVIRAFVQNIRAGRIVSGGSTITMQVIRLSRRHTRRTIGEKIVEAVLAVRCDLYIRKGAILSLYTAHAPFGGNVVGLEAAAWRYFGRNPDDLSWAETAMLAVLPNEPTLVHPGRNRARLLYKRNLLLSRLCSRGAIDSTQYRCALLEPLPTQPCPLPDFAPQLVERIQNEQCRAPGRIRQNAGAARVRTTLDNGLQRRVSDIVGRRVRDLSGRGIKNAAALVLSVERGEALAYVGNAPGLDSSGGAVDIITARRSTGSVLKPLLYAAMLDQGELLSTTLVADIPTSIGGFSPQNYNRSYEGAVPASMALARSLNIPAVRMVQSHGVERFRTLLVNLGMTTLPRTAADYGISIILGGAESSLWELTGIYAGMARTVNRFADPSVSENDCFFFPPTFRMESGGKACGPFGRETPLSPAACWSALVAMQEVVRPGEESAWKEFTSSRRVAWKTGTSFGFRDGWAIGCTPQFAIGIWVGNASGEGRPGLIGIETAAPILFDVLGALPQDGRAWFAKPELQLRRIVVCRQSGYKAGQFCDQADTVEAPEAGQRTGPCPYHQVIHVDKSEQWRVTASCAGIAEMHSRPWFVLPPAMEYYYRTRHSDYRVLPPWRKGCEPSPDHAAIGLIYPPPDASIFVPREIDGTRGRTVFEATHRDHSATLYWHIDDAYIGSTSGINQLAVNPAAGPHVLVIVDNAGERLERKFTIIDK